MLDREEDDRRLKLYYDGLNDTQIAKAIGKRTNTVRDWRVRRRLAPINKTPLRLLEHADEARRYELHEKGMGDAAIAKDVGVSRVSITYWRRSRGLKCNNPRPISRGRIALRLLRYRLGWSDGEISRAEGMARPNVHAWRVRHGLKPNAKAGRQDRTRRAIPLEAIVARIRRAVGMRISEDIADDVASEMTVAVFSGELSIDEIEKQARRFVNKFISEYASPFGPRSLDLAIDTDHDYRLIDTIRDQSADDWLEEMGATWH